jgi:hypothetical protein
MSDDSTSTPKPAALAGALPMAPTIGFAANAMRP